MKIIVFGTGKIARSLLKCPLRKEHSIVAVVDNDAAKWGSEFFGFPIENPVVISQLPYDIILLATINGHREIWKQLLDMGVARERILWAIGAEKAEWSADPLDRFFVFSKKPLVPFEKKPVQQALSVCGGETRKAHDRRVREGFFDAYCQGEGLDIGCGNDPVTPTCSGWDLCNGDAQYLHGIPDESFDFVYSSHCIEHMLDVRVAIANWFRVVRRGGYLIIYGPERDLYEKQRTLPSRFNFDHKHYFLVCRKEAPDTLDICEELREALSTTGGGNTASSTSGSATMDGSRCCRSSRARANTHSKSSSKSCESAVNVGMRQVLQDERVRASVGDIRAEVCAGVYLRGGRVCAGLS
ncbi:methyltransferase domain-containing protein [uncultured Selenomonas sp.]|uniref:methyltransferase domain-containing protein n=1 Tax=uncultured Selenomonas sp. TaxID=159275 RepID=UPI0025D96E2D|nr:methyltransferase domain-containing protein [uncultured Selenomonas sp.]